MDELKHDWFNHTLIEPTGCNFCQGFIKGFSASMCKICRIMVCNQHIDDIQKLDNFKCRPMFIEEDSISHHWIQGNVTHTVKNGKCMYCEKTISKLLLLPNSTTIKNWRCSWCERTVCEDCFSKKEDHGNCDLGSFAELKVDPRLAKPELLANLPNEPLVVFVNNKSGGGQGINIGRRMRQRLHPIQVFDLFDEEGRPIGPRPGLQLFANNSIRVLIASGDGAISWPMDVVRQMREEGIINHEKTIKFLTLPLGTGCDFSRITGWGPGYENEDIGPILEEILNAKYVNMDRWRLTRYNLEEEVINQKSFILYFSIGVSSEIMAELDKDRKANPDKYNSRTGNKLQIGLKSLQKGWQQNYKNLADRVKIIVDDNEDDIPIIDPKTQSIDLVNGPSYAAGTDLWGNQEHAEAKAVEEKKQYIDDGMIEMLTHQGVWDITLIKFGPNSATKVMKVRKVKFIFKDNDPIHLQYDGEALDQNGGSVEITHLEQVLVGAYNGDITGNRKKDRIETFKYCSQLDENN